MKVTTGKFKTSRLIELAHETDKLIVCFNEVECNRVFNISRDIGRKIHKPISFMDFINGKFADSRTQSILIDNLELCVTSLSNKIEEVTVGDG